MNKEKAAKKIAENLEKMHELFYETMRLSDESGVGFELPWGGEGTDQRGLGGYYSPEGDKDRDWHIGNHYKDDAGWYPSAHSC